MLKKTGAPFGLTPHSMCLQKLFKSNKSIAYQNANRHEAS